MTDNQYQEILKKLEAIGMLLLAIAEKQGADDKKVLLAEMKLR